MLTLIQSQAEFERVIVEASRASQYAIDTEFHREKTYYPELALVQLAWDDQLVLIDPLELDLRPFADLFKGDGICVMHAASQDLEILNLECDHIPNKLIDTQIAAGFLGISMASLVSLLDKFLKVALPKADRLTDWLRRPLSEEQKEYAANDVRYLLELSDLLKQSLIEQGRWEWAEEESEILRTKPQNQRVPTEAVMRIREARSLKGDSRKVATAVAAWRERRAASLNWPVRQVLPDLGVVTIAQKMPDRRQQLESLRGVESRHLKGEVVDQILEAVQQGIVAEPISFKHLKTPELTKHLRPAVALIIAWVSQMARENRLDPAIVATRSDIESLLRGDEHNRLKSGWRQDLVGYPIEQLMSGQGAIAFDADAGLVLESRSEQKL